MEKLMSLKFISSSKNFPIKNVSRRSFLRTAALSSAIGAVALKAKSAFDLHEVEKKETLSWPPQKICPIIDCHLHAPSKSTNSSGQWKTIHSTTKDFVDYLNLCGVDYGIVNSVRGFEGQTAEDFIQANREARELADEHPKRFMPTCLVNGNYLDESIEELIACRTEHGIFWVGELTSYSLHYSYSAPEFKRILDTIAEYEMLCQIHARIGELEPLAKKYRNITFILPHFTPDKKRIFSRIEFVKQNRNVYLDISGLSFSRMGILEYAVETIGADRVLFGSDFTINDPGAVIARVLNAKLTNDVKKQILYDNARQLIKEFDHENKYVNYWD
jgi:predicted TIM-barrel fold metal-dependent hydrolase